VLDSGGFGNEAACMIVPLFGNRLSQMLEPYEHGLVNGGDVVIKFKFGIGVRVVKSRRTSSEPTVNSSTTRQREL